MTGYEFDGYFSLYSHTSSLNLIVQLYYEVDSPQDKISLTQTSNNRSGDNLLHFMVTCSILTISISKN